jgi:hypothetical protein
MKNKQHASISHEWSNGKHASLNDTVVIYYQGMGGTQAEAVDYVGRKRIQTTTGDVIYSHKGIDTIAPECLSLYPEIAEVDRASAPKQLSSTQHQELHKKGINIDMTDAPLGYETLQTKREEGGVLGANINFAVSSLGQATDSIAHKQKYDYALEHIKRNHIILYGASRGGATTFRAIAEHQYPKVDLCVLEAPPSSIRGVVKTLVNNDYYLPRWTGKLLYPLLRSTLFGGQHQIGKEHQAMAFADRFPLNVPLAIVSSIADDTVPHQQSMKLALRVAANRIAAQARGEQIALVYFLQLENTNHMSYGLGDSEDGQRYQNFVHAVYRKEGLPHVEHYANHAESELLVAELTQGPLRNQVVMQSLFRTDKENRQVHRDKALVNLKEAVCGMDEPHRARMITMCYYMPLYAKDIEKSFCKTSSQTPAQEELTALKSTTLAPPR